ncbi:DUF1579 domain-containing protein [bacterium]|nr:DUF1579 domain-containing protein [bacterium]
MTRRLLIARALAFGLALVASATAPAATGQAASAWTAVAASGAAAPAPAPPPPDDRAQALAAWDRAGAPGPWHEFLARRAGRWNVAGRIWNEPGGAPVHSRGESRLEMVLGGRFLQERHKGRVDGRPYEGLGLLGYDNADSTFTAVWVDDLGTRTAILSGRAGAPGEPVELRGAVTDPASGRALSLRLVITWNGAEGQRWEYHGAPEGFEEARLMELVYTRR